jgi:arylsulfatase
MPIEGVSAAATLTDSKAPTKKVVQYFEMLGNRGLWKDGWKVSVFHGRWPWQSEPLDLRPFDQDVWELYNTRNDPSEGKNLAAQYPEKVAELRALWYREAKAHNVLPLDGRSLGERVNEANQMHSRGRAEFVYEGPKVRIPDALAPSVMNRSFFVVAEVEIPAGGAEGVLMADGGSFAGYSIYVKEGRLVYEHNYARVAFYKVTSTEAVPTGRVTLRIDFKNTGTNKGNVTLTVNGRKVGEGEIPQTIPYLYSLSETFDVGSDTITPVSDAYASPFTFTGRIRKLTVSLGDGGAVKSAPDYVAD